MFLFNSISKLNTQIKNLSSISSHLFFSTNQTLCLDLTWRRSKKLPLNPMDRGTLTDGVDYIFLDGRPTPFGMKRKRKLLQQREYAKKIVELSKSLDLAKERYAEKLSKEEKLIKNILDKKLLPKGTKFIKN
ncbi:39S ribosomal protein L52, mitochondrial [Daktulosphaira vitifoliae]|uniref:39S ribosomal protein L52, mitochondrial n=1 Tax=Daktulosphaira vitifoliae TaxID=58002 RepID=UPI0021A9DB64|nr:39S ribosomal protein L52, mitochondrial [Daktulosphaira vitifoliae]